MLWEPAELYPADLTTSALSAPGVAYEGRITVKWAKKYFPELAAQVRVPVEYSAAEHERVWDTTPAALADIAALFTAAPRVELAEVAGSGHNLSVGLAAAVYHRQVLSFIEECLAADGGVQEAEAG